MTVLRSGSIAFRPRARLLKLIGAELISDDVVALTELVKNAHDADASVVTITFEGATQPGGTITVQDDGCGMDLDTVLGVWMEPGASTKLDSGHQVTSRGRRLLGEKGVGRFAVDKLASHLELVSQATGSESEVRALFDWDAFDSDEQHLSSIKSRWELRPARLISAQGTRLTLSGLRTIWSERMFRRLCTRLARLRSPFQELDRFTINIESDEFPMYAGELRTDILDRAPYRIEVRFDGERTFEVRQDGAHATRHPWPGQDSLTCGPLRVRIFSFDLETDSLSRIGSRMDVRAWLREWSGISVYRDGFRLWPYGEPHDDWLRLDQRRVNNPVVRLSNNQVVGFVEISADRNPELRDQTNREGLIHNQAFEDLRRLLWSVLEILEDRRQAVRHPSGQGTGGTLRHSAMNGSSAPKNSGPPLIALRQTLRGYTELAAAAQTSTLLSLSMRPLVIELEREFQALRRTVNGTSTKAVERQFHKLETRISLVAEHVMRVVATYPGVMTSRRTIDVGAELERWRDGLTPLLAQKGVDVTVRSSGLLRIELRPESLHHLLSILARNSLEWLEGARHPRIRVMARAHGEQCEIVFADNGPGFPSRLRAHVLEPGVTGKERGCGMGLAVARSLVEMNQGTIEVLADGRRRGAAIRVRLARKQTRATRGSREHGV